MQDLCNLSMILRMSCHFLGVWAKDQGSSIREREISEYLIHLTSLLLVSLSFFVNVLQM